MSVAIGVDVGGTFTDFFVLDLERNRSWVHKTPSTPADPSEAIRTGLREILLASGVAANSVARIAHGTTVATNALIQRRGAKVALIVTEGFRDLLEIGRQTRPHLYSLQIDAPEPVVPREWRIEAKERVLADGTVLVPLTPGELQTVIDRAKKAGDTVGGVFEVIARGLPPGLGSFAQWDRRLDGRLAQALMSIHAVKAVAVGAGFLAGQISGHAGSAA